MSKIQLTLFPDYPNCASLQRRRSRPMRAAVLNKPDNRGRHINSINAHEAIQTESQRRCKLILNYLARHGPATDRQILAGIFPGRDDMNLVRPRISDLVRVGTLVELSKVRDRTTGHKVRRVQLSTEITINNNTTTQEIFQ